MGDDGSMIQNPAPPIPAPLNVIPPAPEPDYDIQPGESLNQSNQNNLQTQYYSSAPVICADGDSVMVTSGGDGQAYLTQPTIQNDTDLISSSISSFKEAAIDLWKEISKIQDALNFFAQKAKDQQDTVTGILSNFSTEVSGIYPQLGANVDPLSACKSYPNDPNMQAIFQKYNPSLTSAQAAVSQSQDSASQCQAVINQLAAELESLCAKYDDWAATVGASYSNVPVSDDVLTAIVNERVVPAVLPGQPPSANTSMMIAAQNLSDAQLMLAQISPDAASQIGLTQTQAQNIAASDPNATVIAAATTPAPNYTLIGAIVLGILLLRR